MARETKVGLLAGLAFIICFAIILANRGRQEAVTTHLSYPVDRNVAQDAATNGAAVVLPSRAAPASESSSPGELTRSVPKRAISRPPAKKTGTVAFSQGGERYPVGQRSLASPSPERVERRRTLQEYLDAPGSHPAEKEPPSKDAIVGERAIRTATVREKDRNIEQRQASAATPTEEQHTVRRPASGPAPRAPRSLRHTVVRGDTLTRIAAVHYDSRSPAVINAIFDANSSVLSSPDLLRVGVELTLPVLDGVGGAPPVEPTSRAAKRERINAVPHFRWYQIKKNDRYVSIARRQLGNVSRWPEIYELNKDKFPDPQRIREGVRIKLPATPAGLTPAGPTSVGPTFQSVKRQAAKHAPDRVVGAQP